MYFDPFCSFCAFKSKYSFIATGNVMTARTRDFTPPSNLEWMLAPACFCLRFLSSLPQSKAAYKKYRLLFSRFQSCVAGSLIVESSNYHTPEWEVLYATQRFSSTVCSWGLWVCSLFMCSSRSINEADCHLGGKFQCGSYENSVLEGDYLHIFFPTLSVLPESSS